MRYLLGVLFLASCTTFTPLVTDEPPVTNETPMEPHVSTIQPQTSMNPGEVSKPKSKTASPIPEISSCATLNAGNVKETIKAKLDCITETIP
ncbi:hypothetical protein SAMN05216404_10152 [Nitrosospira multiformis]|uniref:Uncharacterized protein n=1 Tax=Nitrosospira multiformis TaxID=1231 RepID=A0A1H8AZ51_9PROT|nr:hypothetical protein [Nitrosospira multiformis]SEM75068.1 hypothetical protein SAMN05216404_10152 [Nitrosospira multiformis]